MAPTRVDLERFLDAMEAQLAAVSSEPCGCRASGRFCEEPAVAVAAVLRPCVGRTHVDELRACARDLDLLCRGELLCILCGTPLAAVGVMTLGGAS